MNWRKKCAGRGQFWRWLCVSIEVFLISLKMDQKSKIDLAKEFYRFYMFGTFMFQVISPSKYFFEPVLIKWGHFRTTQIAWGLRRNLWVDPHNVINDQPSDGIWQFQKQFWNHKRLDITDSHESPIKPLCNLSFKKLPQ